jgi:hypothetical protein
MVIHLLTCLALTAFTSYVLALMLFDTDTVQDTPAKAANRATAPAN